MSRMPTNCISSEPNNFYILYENGMVIPMMACHRWLSNPEFPFRSGVFLQSARWLSVDDGADGPVAFGGIPRTPPCFSWRRRLTGVISVGRSGAGRKKTHGRMAVAGDESDACGESGSILD
ncbi:MAG: hypothetical protein F8N37_22885 [Telmatospirillum sp.]|nr:hypothetical protein [Telmatospirillum sp.]